VLHEVVISLETQLLALLRQEAHGLVGLSQFEQALSRAPNSVKSPPELDGRAICRRTTNCGGNAIVTIVFLRLDGIEKLLNVNACFAPAVSKQSEPASAEDSLVHDRDGWRFIAIAMLIIYAIWLVFGLLGYGPASIANEA
jgi:hypothetical protein